ncbi:precorrin-6y C5,15-methyltransferase (decarboxylating) subunit CbiE [Ahrensia kielensis]|uniref:Precorrin-6y C5,15-methyltransferase (Decarboxylating) subunit CbiE n=1 Tax=Ahrensia kielensis TaxID=76980 RepID=A0ABU9T5Y2_9HYPH
MSSAWLNIIGIGEDGIDGLSQEARALISAAEIIIGGDRHHKLANAPNATRIKWPSPFDAMIDTIKSYKGKPVVVLVTGDPLWYSVGARIGRAIPAAEIAYHPQLSAFQWAAARLGWSLADVETLTVHGRAAEQIVPYFAPDVHLLILTKDKTSPETVAELLVDRGYGASKMTVLAALGGPNEARFEGVAESWKHDVPDFHTLAVECVAGAGAQILPRTGLNDDAFVHDGKMTKRAVRALALSKLAPTRGALLWDIGCGCGSIAIEWMRGAPEAQAIGLEPREDRRAMAQQNAAQLGTPKLKLVDGQVPHSLAGLPAPDAVFIGGGLSMETVAASIDALKPHGRLVAHAVTVESEAVLLEVFAKHGGELQRISVESVIDVGSFHGWKPSMPVTQWSWSKDL